MSIRRIVVDVLLARPLGGKILNVCMSQTMRMGAMLVKIMQRAMIIVQPGNIFFTVCPCTEYMEYVMLNSVYSPMKPGQLSKLTVSASHAS